MKASVRALVATVLLCVAGGYVIYAQRPAPCLEPDRDPNNPAVNRYREAKKAEMRRRGYPERFLKLLDQEKCIACLRLASDAFHIMIVYKDNAYAPKDPKTGRPWTHISYEWDPESEVLAREKLKDGTIKGFYILNTFKHDCPCCPEMDDDNWGPQKRSDWNEDLEANMDHLIPFDQSNTTGPLPDDLINPPAQWLGGDHVPNIEKFQKPAKKQVHAVCPKCQDAADRVNAAYDTLDSLWNDKIKLQSDRQITERAVAERAIQIERLRYKQRSVELRTDAREKEIEFLEGVNRAQTEDLARDDRNIAAATQKIIAQGVEVGRLLGLLKYCESNCATIVTADTNGTNTFTPRPDPPPAQKTQTGLNLPEEIFSACPGCAGMELTAAFAWAGLQVATQARDAARADAARSPAAVPALANAELRLQEADLDYRAALAGLEACNAACKSPTDDTQPDPWLWGPKIESTCPTCDTTELWFAWGAYAAAKYQYDGVYMATRGERTPEALQQRAEAEQKMHAGFATYQKALAAFKACNEKCSTPTETVTQPTLPPAEVFTPRSDPKPDIPVAMDPVDNNFFCVSTSSCPDVATDPRIPGNYPIAGPLGGPSLGPLPFNFFDNGPWVTSANTRVEIRIQIKVAEFNPYDYPQFLGGASLNQTVRQPDVYTPYTPSYVVLPALQQQQVREWFNPLGLLARTITQHIDRWRGSIGPRPLINPRDLDAIDRMSNMQPAGLPKGVHVMLMDKGGSTGKTLVMSVLNLSGQPVRLAPKPFAVEPIQQQAQQQVLQAFNRLSKAAPVQLDMSAYCVEFLKAPPGANTLLRLAPPDVQQKYAAMSKILQSSYRVVKANALHPDSNPAAYTDSIKQWSLWTAEQNLNESRFTEAFIGLTKKNVEAAGQKWPQDADAAIRTAAPNRWRDIVTILRGAGVPVPQ